MQDEDNPRQNFSLPTYDQDYTIVPSSSSQSTILSTIFEFMETMIESDSLTQAINNSFQTYSNELFTKDVNILITLPIYLYDKNDDIIKTCSICLDEFIPKDNIYKLDCMHDFHADCLDKAVQFQHACCPLCRSSLPVLKKDNVISSHTNQSGHFIQLYQENNLQRE